jgi:hypothetical protein
MVWNQCTQIEYSFYTTVHILAHVISFLGIHDLFYGVLQISLEMGYIWIKHLLSLVPDFYAKSFLGRRCLLLSKLWCWCCTIVAFVLEPRFCEISLHVGSKLSTSHLSKIRKLRIFARLHFIWSTCGENLQTCNMSLSIKTPWQNELQL